jgi:hypothetical protein
MHPMEPFMVTSMRHGGSPEDIEAHPGAEEAHTGAVEAHPGALYAHPRALEAHPEALHVHLGPFSFRHTLGPGMLTQKTLRLTLELFRFKLKLLCLIGRTVRPV